MKPSANVRSVPSVAAFHAAVVKFTEEALLCLGSLETQTNRLLQWLERDRPAYWKRQVELSFRHVSEARTNLSRAEMQRYGDYKPSCFDEKKALQRAKQRLQFAQEQIDVVRRWTLTAHHEVNEYRGRSSQLRQYLDGEIPRLIAMLERIAERLEQYAGTTVSSNVAYRSTGTTSADSARDTTDAQDIDDPAESSSAESDPVDSDQQDS